MTRLLIASMFVACLACTPENPSEREEPRTPRLSFTVEGAGFDGQTFGPGLTDVTEHWVYDPRTQRTHVHISGNVGRWRAGVDLSLPKGGPGTYQADTSYRGMDRGFSIALADHADGSRIAFVGADATVTLEQNPDDPDWMSGTFSGRFAVGARTTGRDILGIPPEDRTYATIRDGHFRVRWKDTFHGKGERWPVDPRS